MTLQALRHIYGTLILRPAFCRHGFVYVDGITLHGTLI
jgi:hypothetical protein